MSGKKQLLGGARPLGRKTWADPEAVVCDGMPWAVPIIRRVPFAKCHLELLLHINHNHTGPGQSPKLWSQMQVHAPPHSLRRKSWATPEALV